MTTYINPLAMTQLLNYIDNNTTHVHIANDSNTDFSQLSTISLGSASKPTFTISDITGANGRQLTFNDFNVTVTKAGTVTHVLFVDNTNNRVLVTKAIQLPTAVVLNETMTVPSETIEVATVE